MSCAMPDINGTQRFNEVPLLALLLPETCRYGAASAMSHTEALGHENAKPDSFPGGWIDHYEPRRNSL